MVDGLSTEKNEPSKFASEIILKLIDHCLEKGLGFVADPVEPWFSREAIARTLGKSEKTLINNKVKFPEIAHPLGEYYRVFEFIEKYTEHEKASK